MIKFLLKKSLEWYRKNPAYVNLWNRLLTSLQNCLKALPRLIQCFAFIIQPSNTVLCIMPLESDRQRWSFMWSCAGVWPALFEHNPPPWICRPSPSHGRWPHKRPTPGCEKQVPCSKEQVLRMGPWPSKTPGKWPAYENWLYAFMNK